MISSFSGFCILRCIDNSTLQQLPVVASCTSYERMKSKLIYDFLHYKWFINQPLTTSPYLSITPTHITSAISYDMTYTPDNIFDTALFYASVKLAVSSGDWRWGNLLNFNGWQDAGGEKASSKIKGKYNPLYCTKCIWFIAV